MLKRIGIIVSLLLLGAFGYQIWTLSSTNAVARESYEELRQELHRVKQESQEIERDMGYLLNPINLEKELRARFNYKKPGENMIIIVPAVASSTQ